MDDRRFDSIIRTFATGANRRVVLGGLAAGVGGWLAPFSSRAARTQLVCDGGLVDCGGVCVDVFSDPANCGGCGTVCQDGVSCSGGACFVGSGTSSGTETQCVDACSAPYVQDPVSCACFCAVGLVDCGGVCLDVSADPANCGGCGVACPSGSCVAGACACAAGTELCGGQCVTNCGAPLVLDPATCACICPPGLECGADQTFDPVTCTCSDAPTPTPTPEVTASPEAPATPASIQAPDATGTAAPEVAAVAAVLSTVCLESDQDRALVSASADGPPPARLDITRTVTPTGVDVAMKFAEADGMPAFMEMQGTATPGGLSTFSFTGDGLDYQFEFDERTGDVAVTTGGQRVTGVFNPTTGDFEGPADLPQIAFPDALMERIFSLEPAFDTIIGQAYEVEAAQNWVIAGKGRGDFLKGGVMLTATPSPVPVCTPTPTPNTPTPIPTPTSTPVTPTTLVVSQSKKFRCRVCIAYAVAVFLACCIGTGGVVCPGCLVIGVRLASRCPC